MTEDDLPLSARTIAERLTRIEHRFQKVLHPKDSDALAEACRRVLQQEALVRDVLPDMRRRLN